MTGHHLREICAIVFRAALKKHIWSTVAAFEIFIAALAGAWPAPGTAEEAYPWCTQGSLLHCYYATHDQCEQTVDYHGFCVPNPDVSPQNSEAAWRRLATHQKPYRQATAATRGN